MPDEENLEATSENKGCGRDMLGQTVPTTGSNNSHHGDVSKLNKKYNNQLEPSHTSSNTARSPCIDFA